MIKARRIPAATYGAEVYGVSNELLVSLRLTSSMCAPPRSKRRDTDVALALHDVDVTAEATGPPFICWAQEVWAATAPFPGIHFSISQLSDLWRKFYWSGVTAWHNVAGQLGAIKRLGWTVKGPLTWHDERGVKLNLALLFPAMLKWHVKQSVTRLFERRIADSFGHAEHTGRRANIRAIKRVLRPAKCEFAFGRQEKNALVAVAANAVWTNERLCRANLVESPLCCRCKEHENTIFHSVAVSAPRLGERESRFRHAGAGSDHHLFSRGIGVINSRAQCGQSGILPRRTDCARAEGMELKWRRGLRRVVGWRGRRGRPSK